MSHLKLVLPYARHSARVLCAVGGAWSVATLLHLPQAQWAAISALVVMQDTPGATARAGRDRILATVFGAATGALTGLAHALGWPELLAWAVALVPAVVLASLRREYRTAPIAALIVISSSGAHGSPLSVALLRMVEISVGAVIGVAVSRWLLPTPSRERLRHHARALLVDLAALGGAVGQGVHAQDEARADRIRASLWEVGVVARGAKHEAKDTQADTADFAKTIRRVHEDLAFVVRVAAQAAKVAEFAPALSALGPALRLALDGARDALAGDPAAAPIDVDALLPPLGKGGRAAELWAALRFGIRSLNRQLEALAAAPPQSTGQLTVTTPDEAPSSGA